MYGFFKLPTIGGLLARATCMNSIVEPSEDHEFCMRQEVITQWVNLLTKMRHHKLEAPTTEDFRCYSRRLCQLVVSLGKLPKGSVREHLRNDS
ncbi:Uncharacterized protein APZ42_012498 [Daphnia magna]|uniref:Uncharacterized protein n=1 Tax=Daphnia magna TaxID=35525 RepID=A0A162RVW2_9CRUS|nr:Uncharacterized protein APZ42_012498 [Daphnia magna]